MGKTKPPYPAAFKQQIVELAMAGRAPAKLSREFGVAAQSITAWAAMRCCLSFTSRPRPHAAERNLAPTLGVIVAPLDSYAP